MMREHSTQIAWIICLLLLATPVGALANEGNAEDVDGDSVTNREDRDSDNDGILDLLECPEPAVGCPDSDADGVPDHLDIDSDGDGITDAHEAFGNDTDGDGRYDGFDDRDRDGADDNIVEAQPQPFDSDGDGLPDHLDDDSDDDGIPDSVEGHDVDGDGVPETTPIGRDVDRDGLDDAFDAHCIRVDLCSADTVLNGKPAPTPDLDGDGVEDFRKPAEMNVDAGPDAGADAGPDAGADAGPGMDAGADAGDAMDAGADAGGGMDAGTGTEFDSGNAFENDFYADGGGCSSAPTKGSAPLWLLLAAAGLLRRRRG